MGLLNLPFRVAIRFLSGDLNVLLWIRRVYDAHDARLLTIVEREYNRVIVSLFSIPGRVDELMI